MIIYSDSVKGFIDDVLKNQVTDKIYDKYQSKIGKTTKGEIDSWRNSLHYMSNALLLGDVSKDANVAIEYQVPNTSKRVDFIISGLNKEKQEAVVIVELKQWSLVEKTVKDGIILTYVGGAKRELTHPSYQAWTYAQLIQEYNETVQNDDIQLYPCAYLHNYKSTLGNPLLDELYQEYLDKAPSFLSEDAERLAMFIKRHIQHGDTSDILYRIDHGKIKPSKSLGERIGSMLQGNQEFNMIEEQKVVYEELKLLATTLEDNVKKTVIIKGGPGTGKSVIAINLLVELINNHQLNTQYATRNSAPREVYSALLKGYQKKSFIDNLFKGTGSYVDLENNTFDCLIVDEAHRLNEKSGMFRNLGENQIKEVIQAARLSIFFIDEAQKVHIMDRGSIEEIQYWAKQNQSEVYEMELTSQFRCNGSDGYLAWIDNLLEIRETANPILDTNEFDFRVFDDPNELRDFIFEKNQLNNKARLLAGYCWNWDKDKRNDTTHHDITIPKHRFGMSWNLGSDGMQWLIKPESVHEVGCIHTSQGLELDYIGVIIGDDLRYEHGRLITDVTERAKTDQSVKGWKKGMIEKPTETRKLMDDIIKNTYRTLLTRGMKGCYVYCTDDKLREYLKSMIEA